ncbi:SAM-dependent methyltransferase [Knoellia flava TL1]|uniref:Ribosomal RNA large subunit methyltransferase G n=2 Tax=Knoellia flava TaxID=913969 RepID=A0A8H9FPY5_9MICO|nr:methyltransferase [Knoellia flava]KGN34516.1 SAM-dependent methyltransferase [Knoellia flava TL1]GGB65028.1 ribosomal RNA large subunit methyltransferase G [Knoellia flava]
MSDAHELDWDDLRRWPDVEAPNLQAWDATDRLVLDEAGPLPSGVGEVVVIGDRHGALTLGALARGASGVRVHQDGVLGERALVANATRRGLGRDGARMPFAHHRLDAPLLDGARLVLLQLPRSLDALDEVAALVAAHAHPDVRVVAGGRVKHMSRSMNDVLAQSFSQVSASLARQKSRVLHASSPRPAVVSMWPHRERHDDVGLTVVAHGGVFAGTSVDIGTRLLLDAIPSMRVAERAVDLACGSGVVAAALALARPDLHVLATDQSAAAVASAAATAEANGVADRVAVVRADALETLADASVNLVVLNPPFHIGATVHVGLAERLFADAARALAPGGELWTVWNSHLPYRQLLTKTVGPTEQVHRTSKFIVTVSASPIPVSTRHTGDSTSKLGNLSEISRSVAREP